LEIIIGYGYQFAIVLLRFLTLVVIFFARITASY